MRQSRNFRAAGRIDNRIYSIVSKGTLCMYFSAPFSCTSVVKRSKAMGPSRVLLQLIKSLCFSLSMLLAPYFCCLVPNVILMGGLNIH